MKYFFTLPIILLFLGPQKGNAQWSEVSSFNQVIDDIHTFNGTLFIGGNFSKRNGNTCYWFTQLTGSSFNDQTIIIGGSGVSRFETYNNTLWCTGDFNIGSSYAVYSWDGSSWHSEGNFNKSHTGIFADGNDLYVGSDFGVVSKKSGSGSFMAMPAMDNTSDGILAINKYNGDIVIAGDLTTYNSTALNNIARWDGSAWQPLGGGVSGRIRCLAVYKSELYVGGDFSTAGGQNIKDVAKWNGSSWTPVGGSVTDGAAYNGVRDMVVYNNKLYVVGDFNEMGGVSTKYVATWDGNNWGALSLDQSSNFANCVEVYNTKLYVGTFDFDTSHLYSRQVPNGIDDVEPTIQVSLFPNPTHDLINIECHGMTGEMRIDIVNNQGQVIEHDLLVSSRTTYEASSWPRGIYLVLIRDKKTNQIVARQNVMKM